MHIMNACQRKATETLIVLLEYLVNIHSVRLLECFGESKIRLQLDIYACKCFNLTCYGHINR